ncbi:MAG TPA: hypothetical protein DEB10_10950 [Ruminococcaceae bacterium]|nr:cysteine-rich KTR domain-containing protein [Muricomes intestini]HBI74490.1 hypothetical protein [Lachnospiraceae bacterium]HBT65165.1 hypothetical protein [Oscillospiraceae bacterium]HCR84702.1 hypothetical protein [Lachnospiraceae bacterium]
MKEAERIRCPICDGKIHTMVREDTELKNFPLSQRKIKWNCVIY